MTEQTRVRFGYSYICYLVEYSFQSAFNLEGWKNGEALKLSIAWTCHPKNSQELLLLSCNSQLHHHYCQVWGQYVNSIRVRKKSAFLKRKSVQVVLPCFQTLMLIGLGYRKCFCMSLIQKKFCFWIRQFWDKAGHCSNNFHLGPFLATTAPEGSQSMQHKTQPDNFLLMLSLKPMPLPTS